MRQKRIKSYRKVMALYQSAFKFREPYQLLVDAAFLQAFVQQKLEFEPRLQDVLQGKVKPMITQCCIKALYDLGPAGQAAADVAKTFERRKCNHFEPNTKTEDECMRVMAGKDNPNRYVIATQSVDLRKHLRTVPGTPIIYLNRSVVLLEAPSDQTQKQKLRLEGAKLHAPAEELALLGKNPVAASTSSNLIDAPYASTSTLPIDADPEKEGEGADEPKKKKTKKRGPSGPNPLSVKKKAKGPAKTEPKKSRDATLDAQAKERVERKRKRVEDEGKGRVESLASRAGAADGEARKRKRKRSKKETAGPTAAGAGEAAATATATEA